MAVNDFAQHQSPEYRPREIFRPLVSEVANWHPHSCKATVLKSKSHLFCSSSIHREIHLRVRSKVYSLLLTWTRWFYQATLWRLLSWRCVPFTTLRVTEIDEWPDLNTLLCVTRLSHCVSGIHVWSTSAHSSAKGPTHRTGRCWWKLSCYFKSDAVSVVCSSGQRVWCTFQNSYRNLVELESSFQHQR